MNDTQRKAAAAGFMHALANSREALTEWANTAKDDPAAVGALIQKTVGLANPPSVDDLRAMSTHIKQNLQPQVQEVQAADPAGHHVGNFILAQQS